MIYTSYDDDTERKSRCIVIDDVMSEKQREAITELLEDMGLDYYEER